MSNKPMPAAHTAAMLAVRFCDGAGARDSAALALKAAQLASDLHRLAPALTRARKYAYYNTARPMDRQEIPRLERRVLKLNIDLAQFGCALLWPADYPSPPRLENCIGHAPLLWPLA